jgi:phage tail-like protein
MQNGYMLGIPRERSTWLYQLPEVYQVDDFLGRFLLILQAIWSPIEWKIDNLDLLLAPATMPQEWRDWFAGWFALDLLQLLPEANQRALIEQLPWLLLRRGTRIGLERLLTLYCGSQPEIIEDRPGHFTVRMSLSESHLGRGHIEQVIMWQKPAFASFDLEVT